MHVSNVYDRMYYDSCFLQQTVVAVLDQMVNPDWPYLPKRQENYETEEEREAIEGVWKTISDDPLNYHFYYHILDGDEGVTLSHLLTWVLNYAIFDEPEKKKNMSRCIEFIFATKHIIS